MTPNQLTTRPGDMGPARSRSRIAEKSLEVAELAVIEDGTAINECVGLCGLSGIAAADAICVAATGERSSGTDHAGAAELLSGVDSTMGKQLRNVVALKPGSHDGDALLAARDRDSALMSAPMLVLEARARTG